jgi:hypothetical protein
MTAKKIRELESVSVRFVWDTLGLLWDIQLRDFCELTAQFGHCLPIWPFNPKLVKWVMLQRHDYKLHSGGKPSRMTADHIRELESAEFVWDSLADFWSVVRFQELCEFKAQFGHCLVSPEYTSNTKLGKWVALREFKAQFGHCRVPRDYSVTPKLGQWVKQQRRNFKVYQEGKRSRMTAERIRELKSVEFVWDPQVLLLETTAWAMA